MMRRLSNILTVLSLALFVTTCVMWARGYWVHDGYAYQRFESRADESRIVEWNVKFGRGGVSMGRMSFRSSTETGRRTVERTALQRGFDLSGSMPQVRSRGDYVQSA